MHITEVNITNFKCFKGKFNLKFNSGINILVGDNESGKSTILEAIHLALTGLFNGKYLRNELTQYIFNIEVVNDYLKNITDKKPADLPFILIEVYLSGDDLAVLEGDGNSNSRKECGVCFKIAFDEKYQPDYERLINSGNVKSLPIEYYDVFWTSCARETITSRSIPLKSAFIDSSTNKYQSGSDIYISRIVKEYLETEDVVNISQAHRKMKESFLDDPTIKSINEKIKNAADISAKEVSLSVDLSTKNAWENSLMTYLDEIPFHFIGKGEQSIVKTNLALSHKKSKEANVLLIEEPENHLSHHKLNRLIREIVDKGKDKQIIITTHSSFVANKLGLENLILLHDNKKIKFEDLKPDTKSFFQKLAGYDTLRLILCEKAILVEGSSDELIVQKAYMVNNSDKLPIENGIDVISVGTAFLRFLEIAEKISKPVVVVTDNDGDLEAIKKKYENYLNDNKKDFINICFDETIDSGDLNSFNYNTLEPKLLKENSIDLFNKIFETYYTEVNKMHCYMKANKTECALKLFNTTEKFNFPKYILDAIK
mgnify:CR=1 FL=1